MHLPAGDLHFDTMKVTATAIIPARYASTRLPGKPLLADTGKCLIQHVVEAVQQAQSISEIVTQALEAFLHKGRRGG